MRLSWPAVAGGTLVLAVGAAGLVRGAVPQAAAGGTSSAGPGIVVTNAYIRPPVPPTTLAAGYFTVYNTSSTPDTLQSVQTGAGASNTLHTVTADGSMTANATGADIPAKSSLTLSAGTGHVMIGQLFGPLKAGDHVNMALQFRNAGEIDIVATVVPFGQPAPVSSGAPK